MLILASASPRRRELLSQAGFIFQIHPAHIPEDPKQNEDPIAYVVRLAREKAEAVFAQFTAQISSATTLKGHDFSRAASDQTEIGALALEGVQSETLTVSTVKGTGFSPNIDLSQKPRALAPERLQSDPLIVLGADTTVVLDNQILGKPENPADAARMLRLLSGRTHRVITGVAVVTAARTEVAAEVTAVRFLTLSDQEIAAYIATGEPMDKAGAYAIQGRAARWIPRIEGDYFNVVGLPLALVTTLLDTSK